MMLEFMSAQHAEQTPNLSTMACDTHIEPRWQTYLKAMMFALPGIIAWGFACVYLVPKIEAILSTAQVYPSKVDWLWRAPMLLVQHGQSLCIALALVLVLLELFVRGWARHRRVTVGVLVWVVNVAVLAGLTLLLIVVLIAAPSLAHTR
jgi:hypothetical protein